MESLVPKSDFLGLERVANLAAGGETPFLRSHLDVLRWFAEQKSAGMAGRERIIERRDAAAAKIAKLLGCQPDDVGFAGSVADGVGMLAQSLDWRPGDNVVMERWEFPSLLYNWLPWRERGVEIRFLEPQDGIYRAPLEVLRKAVDERTRVLAVSHVSYFTGERHDLAAYSRVARDAGALLVVDATHALGAVPVHAPHADFLFSACYKWVLGTHGVGVCYWNRERRPDWRPREMGWHSVGWQDAQERGGTYTQLATAGVFEPGNPSFIGVCVLDNALDYLQRVGIDRVERHVLGLSGELHQGLSALGIPLLTPAAPEQRAGNVAFEVSDETAWRAGLEAHDVLTWTSDRRVRISTHLYNDSHDVRRAVAAVADTWERAPGARGAARGGVASPGSHR